MRRDHAISCRNLAKSYGPAVALRSADLDVAAGTIHALVGQNGAGKSTFLGLVAGRMAPDSGELEVFGQPAAFASPREARAAGVAAIYQELSIVPAMSAIDNVFLGQMPSRNNLVHFSKMRSEFRKLGDRLAVSIDPDVEAGQLSVADQQILEIMRAVHFDARIILFDEPTASLAPAERESLFALMRELRATGHTMVLVSHNLDEVLKIADEVAVFRNGSLVASRPTADWTKSTLVMAMLGEDVADLYRRRGGKNIDAGNQPRLKVEGLTVPGAILDVSLNVRRGEILGIGGLVGAGRTTLLRALAGSEDSARGRMWIDGKARTWPLTPRAARNCGIALVPEERKTQGLVLMMQTMENITLSDFSRCTRSGLVSRTRMAEWARQASRPFRLDPARLSEPAGNLSGGNQQKALLSRWWFDRPSVLLVDEPTRGIDIGAKAEILDSLRQMADEGISIIMVSSELEELVAVADRVVVLAHGQAVAEIDEKSLSVAAILRSAFQVEERHVQ